MRNRYDTKIGSILPLSPYQAERHKQGKSEIEASKRIIEDDGIQKRIDEKGPKWKKVNLRDLFLSKRVQ
jgi:hypothetical protein